ncbi:hypothetical protein NECAME_14821 [Necator americanus]|uniref:Uncharacterized protein n=1 Tax=Necator americanus TaxID=51031 RepID=W2SLE4_NECAM|nr:hypothetical protein NECAME_14821 [Necator americanus]ETN70348.1 hypothetical protein NECAME_14821 [Necator americanus]
MTPTPYPGRFTSSERSHLATILSADPQPTVHTRDRLGKYLSMLPKNRLLEADFSGVRRFHHEMMESILIKNHLDPNMVFSEVTCISFAHCTVPKLIQKT